MSFTEEQMRVFLDRYALKDSSGALIEHQPEQMWQRVADAIANDPLEAEEFYGLLEDFRFVPAGRILSHAGTGHETTPYNCFVIPIHDSREGIFNAMSEMVNIMSRGGGVGINWSVLRPRGAYLRRVNGKSSGPIGWMDVASRAVGEVEQGGSRRGAAMFMLADWHPDIEAFIDAKRDLTKITNANVSVVISNAFMKAVKEDAEWQLSFPDTDHPAYNSEWDGDLRGWMRMGRPIKLARTVRARELWYKIYHAAWDNGEPGIVFLERAQEQSTANSVEKIISVNPCGEQPLGPYSVCNLASLNVERYVGNGKFNFGEFANDVRSAIRFLDNVIDKAYYLPELPAVRENQMKIRRVGLGIMGLADALIEMGYRYGSPEAVEFTKRLFWTMKVYALRESASLAAEKGPALGWSDQILDAPYLNSGDIPEDVLSAIDQHGLRNLLLLTQAPTGTTSMLAGVNSGIEPYFAFGYWRDDRLGKRFVESDIFNKATYNAHTFVTANDVTVEEHIAMQAAAQQYVDASISKTINAPNSHTVEDVERAYMLAWDSGLKGVAYFRDGCRRTPLLNREEDDEQTKTEQPGLGVDSASGHVHRTYKRDGCTYCFDCDWSACEM